MLVFKNIKTSKEINLFRILDKMYLKMNPKINLVDKMNLKRILNKTLYNKINQLVNKSKKMSNKM